MSISCYPLDSGVIQIEIDMTEILKNTQNETVSDQPSITQQKNSSRCLMCGKNTESPKSLSNNNPLTCSSHLKVDAKPETVVGRKSSVAELIAATQIRLAKDGPKRKSKRQGSGPTKNKLLLSSSSTNQCRSANVRQINSLICSLLSLDTETGCYRKMMDAHPFCQNCFSIGNKLKYYLDIVDLLEKNVMFGINKLLVKLFENFREINNNELAELKSVDELQAFESMKENTLSYEESVATLVSRKTIINLLSNSK